MNDSELRFADIERFVTERIEESVRLEFKRQLPKSGENEPVAKAIASLANAEGGSIIYGVDEDEHGRAAALCPFSVGKAAERVTTVAATNLDEPLTLIRVYSVAHEPAPETGYLVVQVPKSSRAPHLVKGMAWERSAKGSMSLTRRRLGELFARSEGFAQEFGMTMGRPGRVRVLSHSEPRHGSSSTDHYLVFDNDGDEAVHDANWDWILAQDGRDGPIVPTNPFPMTTLEPGASARVFVSLALGRDTGRAVRTSWKDVRGNEHNKEWPITW